MLRFSRAGARPAWLVVRPNVGAKRHPVVGRLARLTDDNQHRRPGKPARRWVSVLSDWLGLAAATRHGLTVPQALNVTPLRACQQFDNSTLGPGARRLPTHGPPAAGAAPDAASQGAPGAARRVQRAPPAARRTTQRTLSFMCLSRATGG